MMGMKMVVLVEEVLAAISPQQTTNNTDNLNEQTTDQQSSSVVLTPSQIPPNQTLIHHPSIQNHTLRHTLHTPPYKLY